MPTSISSPDKSRQSSVGKSFFGKKLHKEKPSDDRSENNWVPLEPPGLAGSSSGSRSSRHSKRSSVGSLEVGADMDAASGLSMTAGVITSIPFDSLSPDSKTPISIEYLPKVENPPRKEPSPNNLAKGGTDFHQYPAWDPKGVQNGYGQVNGPRPPPHVSSVTMSASATGDRGMKYQQWGRSGSAVANAGLYSSTTDSSSNSRTSLDQASIHSSQSSATRVSYFSDSNSSRTLTAPQSSSDRNILFNPMNISRSSTSQGSWNNLQPTLTQSQLSSQSQAALEQYLTRPKDDRMVDQLFLELMQKRGWQHLPEQAKRQMLAYPPAKKWTLVHQDRLTELQGEQKRRQNARLTSGYDAPTRADEEGSPEWFVKKVMDDTITSDQLAGLTVNIRGQPLK
jgi:cytokinesis protein